MNIYEFLIHNNIIIILFLVLISIIIIKVKDISINKILKRISNNTKDSKKKITYIKLISHIINYIIIILLAIIILQCFGINVTSIIAGLGVVSVIAGLALQDALKDIIQGFNIIVDNYLSVGDVIKFDTFEGKVIEVSIKCVKFKDINNGNVLVLSNREISKTLKMSNQLDIDIPLPYEEKVEHIDKIFNKIIEEVKENKDIKDIKYLGVNEFGDSAVYYKLRIWCLPELKPSVKRYILRNIKITLDKEGIDIPYTQIDIHNK